jgi:uncharacterized RDD family membrane protein YckC
MKKDPEEFDEDEEDDEPTGPRPALFGERLVAFMIDGLLFYGLFVLTLKLVYSGTPVMQNPSGRSWLLIWAALFVLYHAEAAAAGRPTAGKWLLGLRVVDLDGKPLSFPKAILRALAYFPSSVLNLGFLWAAVHPDGSAWHDLLAGSKVLAVEPRPPALVKAADAVCVALLAGTFFWQQFGAARFYQTEALASTQHTLKALSTLETVYRQRHGNYTENLDKLVSMTDEPEMYYRALASVVETERGILIHVQENGQRFTVIAYGNDPSHTQIKIEGPAKA